MSSLIDYLGKELNQIQPDPTDKLDKLIQVLKYSLQEYPTLKEKFEKNQDPEVKQASLKATRWLLEQINEAFQETAREMNVSQQQIFALLYQSDKLTPLECQQFLQARATIIQYADEIYKKDPIKRKKTKPLRVKI